MQILTYPFGVLVGTLTIAVDLGSAPPPAELRFDGRKVCALAQKLSSCEVDLGPAPRVDRTTRECTFPSDGRAA